MNYILGVLVNEMQTWDLTIGPPGLDNPGFKWLPNIHLLPIVSLSSNVVVPKFKTQNSKHTIARRKEWAEQASRAEARERRAQQGRII